MLAYILLGLSILFITLYFVTKKTGGSNQTVKTEQKVETVTKGEEKAKKNYGELSIFYGTQTGTAAKLAEQLAEEGTEMGFEPEVIDLKNVDIQHFEGTNRISVFLLSNTGEGDPPDNTVRFMNILKLKESIHQVKQINWKQINFTIFGLGNTQYEHYNQTGRVADRLFEKNRSNRIFKLGQGDDNCSLEDDFAQWRKELWPALIEFRQNHQVSKETSVPAEPLRKLSSEVHGEVIALSNEIPSLANYRLYLAKDEEEQEKVNEEILDFKTKASLKAERSSVLGVKQIRQNQKDGSTLELEIELQGQPEYQTAGNIALYSKNDPALVKDVMQIFDLKEKWMDKKLKVMEVNTDKKIKLNFVPKTLRSLLEESVDLQGRVTKSILKKLSKFESNSKQYFIDNSSIKTTEEYKRITEKAEPQHWYNLIRLIKQYQVRITLEDFIELSDSMAPRLFTIASHYKTQKNVIVAASIVQNGLISKFFLAKPTQMKAELRKSTFTDAMKWQKVIFVAAGTGLAPFRAYIQEKVFNIQQNKQGKKANVPLISLFFGCKHQNGDFIYKEQIMGWKDSGIINRLHLAFSRDYEKKVYVQNLLEKEEAELNQLAHDKKSALYMCGSLPMGASIIEVLTKSFGSEKVKEMQKQGRIVKQLW